MKYIIIENEKLLFLQYDNNDKSNNRILIYLSEMGMNMLSKGTDWHIDGTFKHCPKLFYQLVTIQSVHNNQVLQNCFIFMEHKSRASYLEAFQQIKQLCFDKKICINPTRVSCDFEEALHQALQITFPNIELKGCMFHYCQALLRKINNIGYKNRYLNDERFKYWIRQFMILAVIPIDHLKDAIISSFVICLIIMKIQLSF